jgi:glycosyltransferase involved in cell wall biosynthesis
VTKLRLQRYSATHGPPPGSVPVSVVILTHNEELNIARCLASVAWADQVVVVDSGSTDDTAKIALDLGAEIVEQEWMGFSQQRELGMRHPVVRHDWIYIVDADEWVSAPLATEISAIMRAPGCAAFAQRLRLVFQGTWIRHCGWYRGSWNVRLLDRRHATYDGSILGERLCVDGPTKRLTNDIVDEDLKGLAAWLNKHVRYAQLEAERRGQRRSLTTRIRSLRTRNDNRPTSRAVLKDVIYPSVPAKPAMLFLYMYIARLGVLDGLAGLRFCLFHAWYELVVSAVRQEPNSTFRERITK